VRVPANTTAQVFVPSRPESVVTEGGAPVASAAGLRVLGREPRFLICEATSGVYVFGATL
jgi:alpha-L-rhamnosidase